MKARKEDKFIVLKKEDLDNYFSQFTAGLFSTEAETKVINAVPFKQVLEDLKNSNKYIICNQDEPYAETVWKIILMGEDAKKANWDEKKLQQTLGGFAMDLYRLKEGERDNMTITRIIKERFPFMEERI